MKKEEATETEFDAFKVSCREHSYSSSARNEPCLFDERRDHPIAPAGDDGRIRKELRNDKCSDLKINLTKKHKAQLELRN